MDTELTLTPEQEAKIVEAWNSKKDSLRELTQVAFGGEFDGRSVEGKAVKKFLASRQLKTRNSHEYKKKEFSLTDEQKEFIKNNQSKMSPLEMTRTLFSNINLGPLTIEARAVRDYCGETGAIVFTPPDKGEEVCKEYRAPRSIEQAVARINKYVFKSLDANNLNAREKQNIDCLVSYMNVFRYIMVMNEFTEQRDRDLMESSFIRFIYEKGDLTEEEVDLYINLALDIVNYQRMMRELNGLIKIRDENFSEGHIPKALVDQINQLRQDVDSSLKRQKVAQNDLSGKRKDRIENASSGANILQLVEAFKSEQQRKRIVQLAEARKKELGDEMKRLTTLDGLKFEIFGLSPDEILNGL